MCAWVRVDDKLHDNDKFGAVSDAAFRLWVLALSWSNDKLTDGHIPTSRPLKLLGLRNEKKTIAELIEAKLWHRAASPCRSCEQQRREKHGDAIPSGGYVIHDYFIYQRAAWVIRAERETKSRVGRAGAEARWGSSPNGSMADGIAPGMADGMAQGIAGGNAKGGSRHSTRHGTADAPVPPYPRSTRTKYEVPDEPAIPDEPERSKDRRGTRAAPAHIGAAVRRIAGDTR